MGLTLLSAVVFVASVCLVQANSAGPPSSACSSLTPGHNTGGQTSAVPYQIDLAQFSDGNGGYEYTPGQTYTLTLSDPAGSTFRGFFVQSRLSADGTSRVGTFAVINSGSSQLSPCSRPEDGVVHINNNNPRTEFSSMTMNWTAPSAGAGPIQFAYAVVRMYSTFWANQRSAELQEATPDTAQTSSPVVVPTTSLTPSSSSMVTDMTPSTTTVPSVQPSLTVSLSPSPPTSTTTPLLETMSPTPSATPGSSSASSASLLLLLLSMMGAMLRLF